MLSSPSALYRRHRAALVLERYPGLQTLPSCDRKRLSVHECFRSCLVPRRTIAQSWTWPHWRVF